jgi:hypothetical protein
MNAQLKQQIDEKLEHLSEQYVAEVLDFVQLLENRQLRANRLPLKEQNPCAADAYLSGVEQMLNEWSGAADEAAYRDL